MGLDADFAHAFAKSQLGAGTKLPDGGTVFISVKDADKPAIVPLAKRLADLGFNLMATHGTARFLNEQGIAVERVNKMREGSPHCVDSIRDGRVNLVINTTAGAQAIADSYPIRRSALVANLPHYTTVSGARAAILAIDEAEKHRDGLLRRSAGARPR